jgi:hypothetical protein
MFPHVSDALCFSLHLSSKGSPWARECIFAVDGESLETLANLIAPYGRGGEILLSEDTLRGIEDPFQNIFRGGVLAQQGVLDAMPLEDLESPPLHLFRLCALGIAASVPLHVYDPLAVPQELISIPPDVWRKVEIQRSRKKGGDTAAGAPKKLEEHADAEASVADSDTSSPAKEDSKSQVVDIFAPFEKTGLDTDFSTAVECLDPNGDTESKRVLMMMWEEMRQKHAEDSRKVQLLETQLQELTEKHEQFESNQKQSAELLMRYHKILRHYRSKLDVFFKKGMVEEVVYGGDADIFVTDWLAAMKAVAASGPPGGAIVKSKAAFSPREEFASLMRQCIDDDGSESRANPTRLYSSLVGHLGKIFSGIEKLLKQRERITRVGAAFRKPSLVRPPPPTADRHSSSSVSASPISVASAAAAVLLSSSLGRTQPPSDNAHASPTATVPAPAQVPAPSFTDDRKKSVRSKMRSVFLLDTD